MRIAIIGGGPGGLLFAVLMKRADPSHEITVFERNAPDATFGFGVVFPERSLRYLREADPDVHEAFTQTAVAWDAIQYQHKGRVLRCGGHVFSGIARMDLLTLLQRQAGRLGVDLRFQHDVGDLSAVSGCDMVVGADGINSLVRRELAERFRPTVHVGRSKFIWLGTTKVFDALTFIFEESEHGWIGVHIYPYSAAASTFIVETDDATWRRAGFDRHADAASAPGQSDLASLKYCERLFAGHLDGHPLLANNSKWLNFPTVRNRAWHAGNVVLLGDAAHTAHFSVGSGTRLAMEDAIALAHALQHHAGLDAALAAYERERQPAVRRIQRAAEPSRRWWECYRHWTHFEPEQFAFHHLARTRLLTYGTLKVRDAGAVHAVETWFARTVQAPSATPSTGEVNGAIAPLSAPLRLRDVVLANRVVAAPVDGPAVEDDVPGTQHLGRAADSAAAGAGLVMIDSIAGSPDIDAWRRMTESVHAHTLARIGLQLGLLRPAAATGGPFLNDYMRSAQLGADAGFDLLTLHCAVDSEEGALDLFEAVRTAWPAGRPICVRLSGWENPEDDSVVDAGLRFARALKARGCDVLALSVPRSLAERDPERAREGQIFASDLIRNVVGMPTMIVGGLYTVGDVNVLILAGRADLCEWPRLAWPGWQPARDGRVRPG